tara:strand:+ start:97 stop:975 length:879 start_codon:yes stop_codon:yes gene_type:complete
MYNVLILGCGGMLGGMVERVLSKNNQFNVRSSYQEEKHGSLKFNVENGVDELQKIFEDNVGFDYVINCVGILNSNIDENDPNSVFRAIRINALFPHELAILAQEFGVRVIQISTDGVFAKNAALCMEDSPRNCYDVYGKTKSLGEVISPNFLNLRCSIIGPSPHLHKGLLEWFLSQPKKVGVNGYTDQIWNGVTTLQFADLCRMLIVDNNFDVVRNEAPTHHFCPNEVVTKYKLLQLFKSYFRPDIIVKPINNSNNEVSRTLGTNFQKIKKLFEYDHSMRDAIEELAKEILN